MKAKPRIFKPFPRLVVPVMSGFEPAAALALASALGGNVTLVGLVPVLPDVSPTVGTLAARKLRKAMRDMGDRFHLKYASEMCVAANPLDALQCAVDDDPPDLLVLEWPQQLEFFGRKPAEVLAHLNCDVAVVRGPWPEQLRRILVPVRGGPYAELALRLGVALPHENLLALHLSSPGSNGVDAPFQGLARVLPNLQGITYRREAAEHPLEMILHEAEDAEVVVMGASAQLTRGESSAGTAVERLLNEVKGALVFVRTSDPLPEDWSGVEGERSGQQAISLLVDRWFAENTYHADEFDDLEMLLALKRQQGVTISLALPALNEEETVGTVIQMVKSALMERIPLLDEIVLVDSNSSDRTREIAREQDVPVFIHQQVLPQYGARRGKGEALWKSLHLTRGDLLVWIDTDIVNIHPRFVYGVLGPLLLNPRLQFVKGFYQRPLKSGDVLQAGGGGRVTELTARPLLNLFYPELSGIIQPLSGEYGGRRTALEQMPFYSGYGVEIGLLIGIFEKFGLASIAQVDLLERVHHNQSLEALSKMSFTILQTIIRKLEGRYKGLVLEEVNKTMKLIRYEEGSYYLEVEEVAEHERPPMISLPEYQARH